MAITETTAPDRRRPAIPPPIRVRQNVLALLKKDPSHPIVTFYGKAIAEMRKKPITDPTSWRFQAAMHDYNRAQDPFAVNGEALPSASDRAQFWGTPRGSPSSGCQHASWFFLPWHRMYIHHFERIIMGHVARLGGPTDWALPYWNYSGSKKFGLTAAESSLLPPAFRDPAVGGLPDLFVQQRAARANAGTNFVAAGENDSLPTLKLAGFPPDGVGNGFGGPKAVHHDPGPAGSLEVTPHGSMHNAVSGSRGFMGGFTTAPLDPIFWLHHCNVDRLWEVWRTDPARKKTEPTTNDWLTQPFDFHDATGTAVKMTAKEVLDITAAPLVHEYDDTGDTLT